MKAYYSFIPELNLDNTFIFDPITSYFIELLEYYGISSLTFILFFNTILFLFLSLRFDYGINYFKSILISFSTGLGLFLLDSSGLTFLIIAPCLQIYFCSRLLLSANINKKFYLSVICLFLILHALLLAGPAALFCLLLVYIAQNEDKSFNKKILFQISFFLLAFFIVMFPSYQASFLDYPIESTLSEFSPLIHFASSDFGQERRPFPIPYNLFSTQKYLLGYIFLAALCPIFFAIVYRNLHKKVEIKSIHKLFIISFILLTTSLIIREKVSISLFDSALIKSFPGLLWRPFPNLIGIISLFFAICTILEDRKLISIIGLLSVGLISLFCIRENKLSQLRAIDYAKLPNNPSSFMEITPSYYVLDLFQKSFNKKIVKYENIPTKDILLSNQNCTVSSNTGTGVELALDGDEKTKWSTKRPQKNGDYFEITCKNYISSTRLKLNINSYKSDFPRGFEIVFDAQEKQKITFPKWLGSLKYTANGLPYFGHQGEVILDLPEKITFNSIKITLLSSDSTYDWSIGELESYY